MPETAYRQAGHESRHDRRASVRSGCSHCYRDEPPGGEAHVFGCFVVQNQRSIGINPKVAVVGFGRVHQDCRFLGTCFYFSANWI